MIIASIYTIVVQKFNRIEGGAEHRFEVKRAKIEADFGTKSIAFIQENFLTDDQ